ncbi:hypothetical protein D9M72_430620 [compost metagenome]
MVTAFVWIKFAVFSTTKLFDEPALFVIAFSTVTEVPEATVNTPELTVSDFAVNAPCGDAAPVE